MDNQNNQHFRGEIIFNRGASKAQGGPELNEDIDLEIILLGPEKVQTKNGIAKRFRQKIGSKTSESSNSSIASVDSSGTNSQSEKPSQAPVAIDGNDLTPTIEAAKESNDIERTDQRDSNDKGKTTPTNSSSGPDDKNPASFNPLDRMERRFRDRDSSGPRAEDRLHIDYMDYF